MIFSRRKFICGATATSLVVPSFMGMLTASASAANDTILVIFDLQGGNDGYGMIYPLDTATYGNYQSLRSSFVPSSINTFDATIDAAGTGFSINSPSAASGSASQLAMHPSLGALSGGQGNLRSLYGAGKLAFISGVGIPPSAPLRTDHQTSSYYQGTGQLSPDPAIGWGSAVIGQLGNPATSIVSLNGIGAVVTGAGVPVLSISTLDNYGYNAWHDGRGPATTPGTPAYGEQILTTTPTLAAATEYARSIGGDALGFISEVQAWAAQEPASDYRTVTFDPTTKALRSSSMKIQLKQAARLILANNAPVRVIYASAEGFDTHADQITAQASLLAELSEALAECHAYLAKYGKSQNVVFASISDFGRRPYENSRSGTDHGTSSISMIMGDSVKGGFYGTYPSFDASKSNVVDSDGNFVVSVDFRAVLSQLITKCGADPEKVMPDYGSGDVDNSLYAQSQEAVAGIFT